MPSSEKDNFRVTLYLGHYYNDHRMLAKVFVSKNMKTVEDLKAHVSQLFDIGEFCFLAQNIFLPDNESVRVLEKDDFIVVVPQKLPPFTQLAQQEEISVVSEQLSPIKKKKLKKKRKIIAATEIIVDSEDAIPSKKKKKEKPKSPTCNTSAIKKKKCNSLELKTKINYFENLNNTSSEIINMNKDGKIFKLSNSVENNVHSSTPKNFESPIRLPMLKLEKKINVIKNIVVKNSKLNNEKPANHDLVSEEPMEVDANAESKWKTASEMNIISAQPTLECNTNGKLDLTSSKLDLEKLHDSTNSKLALEENHCNIYDTDSKLDLKENNCSTNRILYDTDSKLDLENSYSFEIQNNNEAVKKPLPIPEVEKKDTVCAFSHDTSFSKIEAQALTKPERQLSTEIIRFTSDESSQSDNSIVKKRKRTRRRRPSSHSFLKIDMPPPIAPVFKPPVCSASPKVHIRFEEDKCKNKTAGSFIMIDGENESMGAVFNENTKVDDRKKSSASNETADSFVMIDDENDSMGPVFSKEQGGENTNVDDEKKSSCDGGGNTPSFVTLNDKDVLVFKVLKMSECYTPEYSNDIIGRIDKINKKTGDIDFVIIEGREEFEEPTGKFSLISEEETENCVPESDTRTKTVSVNWKNLISPRSLYP